MPTIDQNNIRGRNINGIRFEFAGNYTGPKSYATNGDPLGSSDLPGIGTIEYIDVGFAADANGANLRVLVYDYTNAKMRWYVASTMAEVANATDLSGYTVRFIAWGK